jgi:hypothetical protein
MEGDNKNTEVGNADKELNISDVISSTDFQNRLKAAIECGVDSDWYWDGENENRIDIFNADDATRFVTELLKEYFL